jgi:hypothetical protein
MKGLDKFLQAFNKKVATNKRGKYTYLNQIEKNTTACIPTVHDAWFAGFVENKGCFRVSFLKGSSNYGIDMFVAQKAVENLPRLSHFILMFHGGHIEKHSGDNVYRFVISG